MPELYTDSPAGVEHLPPDRSDSLDAMKPVTCTMGSAAQPACSGSTPFDLFPKLPVEIRCHIWAFAALRRPRTIQVCFDSKKDVWSACKDGCGGLPTIVHVSREARAEALKPYTKAFDAWVNFEEDIVFVSDPVFSIRRPRTAFLSSEHANRIQKLALTSDIFRGLSDTWEEFPEIIEAPGKILRSFVKLKHFILALSEDGAGFYDGSSGSSEGRSIFDADDEEDDEDPGGGQSLEDIGPSTGNGTATQATAQETLESERRTAFNHRLLDRLDKEAMATMEKGYFRHVGNIHLDSALSNRDHFDNWWWFREEVVDSCCVEKLQHPEWIQPKVSIMAVKYGLKQIGDYEMELHYLGDHKDGVVERGGSELDQLDFGLNDILDDGDLDDDDDDDSESDGSESESESNSSEDHLDL